MKFLISFLILISGCSYFKIRGTFLDKNYREEYIKRNPQLQEEWKEIILKGEIPIGMEKEEVEKILGKEYQIYESETGMMEIWFFENYYVGFDKNGKVIKFKIFEKNE